MPDFANSRIELEALEARALLAVDLSLVPTEVYRAAIGSPIEAAGAGDIDGDGDNDLVIGAGGRVVVLRNRGNGRFMQPLDVALPDGMPRRASTIRVDWLEVGDFDGDGRADVAAAGQARGPMGRGYALTWLLKGDGGGRLSKNGLTRSTRLWDESDVLAVVDTDGDGADELLDQNMRAYGFVNGKLTRGTVIAGGPWEWTQSTGVADIDGDGDTDLVTLFGQHPIFGTRRPTLLRNTGHGFVAEELLFSAEYSMPVARDLTGDGLSEIVFLTGAYRDGESYISVRAMANNAGRFSGEPQLIYEESYTSIRARGGHPAQVPGPYFYEALVSVADVRNVGGDARPDVVLLLQSDQQFADRPTGPVTDSFSERYGVALIATGAATPGELPSYAVESTRTPEKGDDVNRPRGLLTVADFDGDGLDDRVFGRGQTAAPMFGYAAPRLLFVDFARRARPVGIETEIHLGGTEVLERGATVQMSATFRKFNFATTIAGVEVFIDSNGDGRLDGTDRRIGGTTTPEPGSDSEQWSLILTRRPFWGRGTRTLFFVAQDEVGLVSVPLTSRVVLV